MKYFGNSFLVIAAVFLFILSCAENDRAEKGSPETAKDMVEESVGETPSEAGVEKGNTEPTDEVAEETVLAQVGDQIITETDVLGKLALVPEQFRERFETPEAKKKLLDQTVNSAVLMQEARRIGIDRQEDVAQKVNEIANNIIIQELTRQEIVDKIEINEEEQEQYYNENKKTFFNPEKIDASLILFSFNEDDTEETKARKKKKAEETLARLKSGADFAELAKELSDDQQTARRGGKLGYFSKGKQEMMYGTVFEEKAFSLEPGETSDVFEGTRGFYIVRVADKKPEKQESFEEAKKRIQQILMQEKQQNAFDDYMEKLKEKYSVKVYEDRL